MPDYTTTKSFQLISYLDPAFYHSIFLKLLFLSITNEFDCLSSPYCLSFDHAVKYLALAQGGLTRKRVIITCKYANTKLNHKYNLYYFVPFYFPGFLVLMLSMWVPHNIENIEIFYVTG